MPNDSLNQQVGVLTRREIEARILEPFLAAVSEELGEEKARELLARVVVDAARASGRDMREEAGSDGLEAFADRWEPWFRGGALEIDEIDRSGDSWRFDVTRCRYAELYRSLGMADLGVVLSCNRDAALIEGWGDDVTLERTTTLMQGGDRCDFWYRRSGSAPVDPAPPPSVIE
jgi:hypothetical protein